jgi:signal transduction histidine kinase
VLNYRVTGGVVGGGGDSDGDGGVSGARLRQAAGPPPGADARQWWAFQAADAERRRIAADLHDGAQQRLIALRIEISLAAELIPDNPAAAVAQLERLGAEIDAVLAELQDLAHGIYPPTLARRGLADALSEIARELPLPVRLDARGLRRYPELIETTVYFICREALQNAVKHAAGAQGVDVTLADTGTRLTFEVADDGCGFDADAPPGVGFQTMRSRIAAAGGELTIPATAGAGTHVRGSLPLPHRRPTRKGRLSSARRRVPGSTESTDA